MEKLSRETPIFIVSEGSEPQFFTRFFNWDSAKSHVSSLCPALAYCELTPILFHEIFTPTYACLVFSIGN
jgi:hypothetical protein